MHKVQVMINWEKAKIQAQLIAPKAIELRTLE
jgi:hypothetical protein